METDGHYCALCGIHFERPQHLTEHHLLCHSGVGLIQGVHGGGLTNHLTSPPPLQVNSNIDANKSNFTCLNCNIKCSSTEELDEHYRLAHQSTTYLARCPVCNVYGITPSSLEDIDYKCMHCGSIVNPAALNHEQLQQQQQQQQQQHQNYHQPQTRSPQQITHDGKNMKHQQQQTVEQQEQQQIKDKQQHKAESPLKVPPLTVKLNKINESNKNVHPQVVIKQEPLSSRDMDNSNGSPNAPGTYPVIQQTTTMPTNKSAANVVRHKCPDCTKTFKTIGTLAMHRKIHTGQADIIPKERPFPCSFCGKSFTQSNTLKQHTRIHTGEKPFRCGYCGRAFTVKDYLNKHITTHTGEKPYHCGYCEKSFSVKDYLTKHIRTHTGEKPYICPYCDKRFTQRSALTVHQTKIHPL